MSTLPKLMLL